MICVRPEEVKLVAEVALASVGKLTLEDRAKFFTQLALLLEGDDAEEARHNAFLCAEADRAQLRLFERIRHFFYC